MSHDPSVRPRDHFAPQRGWLNDPNGLIAHEGEFHLFFQHHPDSVDPGPISWGHAVSSDLLDWTELPIALASSGSEHPGHRPAEPVPVLRPRPGTDVGGPSGQPGADGSGLSRP